MDPIPHAEVHTQDEPKGFGALITHLPGKSIRPIKKNSTSLKNEFCWKKIFVYASYHAIAGES